MSQPITWRNVDGPSLASAGPALLAAQNSFNASIEGLQQALAQRQAVDRTNEARTQEGDRQAFLDAVAGASTPEQLAQLQQSGTLAALHDRLDPTSRAAVRGAEEARLRSIQQGVTNQQAFAHNQLLETQRPLREQFENLLGAGSLNKAKVFLDENPELIGIGTMRQAVATAEQNATTRARVNNEYARRLQQQDYEDAEAARQRQEAGRQRALGAEVSGLTAAYQARVQAARDAAAPFLKAFNAAGITGGEGGKQPIKVPMNSDGTPDITALTTETRAVLDTWLKEKKAGVTVADLEASDTQAVVSALKNLRASKNFRMSDQESVMAALASGMSTVPVAKIGSDRETLLRENAMAQAAAAESSQFLPPMQSRGQDATNHSDLMAVAGKLHLREANVERLQSELAKFKGIQVTKENGEPEKDANGNAVFIKPTPDEVYRVLSGVSRNWGFWNGFSVDEYTDALKKWAEDPNNIRAARAHFQNGLLGATKAGLSTADKAALKPPEESGKKKK